MNHSTVMHGWRKVEARRSDYADMTAAVLTVLAKNKSISPVEIGENLTGIERPYTDSAILEGMTLSTSISQSQADMAA